MKLLTRKTFVGLLATGVMAIALLLASGLALATHRNSHIGLSGGQTLAIKIQTDWGGTTVQSPSWAKLTGTGVIFEVVAGTTRLFDARFQSQSICFKTDPDAAGICYARIVAENLATGSIIELHPRQGGVFDFALTNEGEIEALEIERSIRLGPGSYRFYVQTKTSGSTTVQTLEFWHFAVARHE
jgi:hypothetical protein